MKVSLIFKLLLIPCVLMGASCQKILNKYVLEPSLMPGDEVSVLMFSDSASNDHEMIQMAVDYAADHGVSTVFVPSGEYLIDAAGSTGGMGIALRDNIHLKLEDDAILKAIPNDTATYYILRVHDVENVRISGGKIFGDRNEHLGSTGEWGMGIDLRNTTNIRIDSVYITNCWGDGIYIGKGSNFNIQIDGVICDNNRRQGMSITNADSVLVKNSKFINTNGTAPQAGIDLEPNSGNIVSNVNVVNCDFNNNLGRGLDIVGLNGQNAFISVESCRFSNNNSGISASKNSKDITISNVEIVRSLNYGINMAGGPSNITILNARIDSCSVGIRGRAVEDVKMDEVEISNYQTEGIYSYEGSENIEIKNSKLTTSSINAWGIRSGTSESIEIKGVEIKGGAVGISSGYDNNIKIVESRVVAISEYPIKFFYTNNSLIENSYIDSCVSKHSLLLQYANNNVVSDNSFRQSAFVTDNTYSYIVIDNTSNNNELSNNVIVVDSPSTKSKYAIWLKSATFGNIVYDNVINSNAYVISAVHNEGTGNTVN